MGTMDIVSGATVVVSYSKPRGVLSFWCLFAALASGIPLECRWECVVCLKTQTHLGTWRRRDGGRQCLTAHNQRYLVHQRLDLLGVRAARPQLAELGHQARVFRDVDVGWEGRHFDYGIDTLESVVLILLRRENVR